MDNFDLKKYLVENKITKNSQLNEDNETMIRDYADALFNTGKKFIRGGYKNHFDVEDGALYMLQNPKYLPQSMDLKFFKKNYSKIVSLASDKAENKKRIDTGKI